jgi:tripartite-type tricarboxylate transporter receptor subunit TctC
LRLATDVDASERKPLAYKQQGSILTNDPIFRTYLQNGERQMKSTLRRHLILGLTTTLLAGPLAFAPAVAQQFPDKPITMIVAWPAGGAHDTVGRLVAEYLSKELGQPVVVNNLPGAAGTTGVRQAAAAEPDGYTIGVMGLHVVAQTYMNASATPFATLAPLAVIERSPAAISVRTDSGIDSLQAFVNKAKSDAAAIINSDDGPGGFANISSLLIQKAIGTTFATIPYQGYAPAVAAIASGETNTTTVPTAQMIGLSNSGDVRILAVAGDVRHPRAPDTPTFTESGFPFVFQDFVGLFTPQGVPEDRVARLEQAVLSAVANPEFLATAQSAGFIIAPDGREGFAAFLDRQDNAVYPILEESGLVIVNQK